MIIRTYGGKLDGEVISGPSRESYLLMKNLKSAATAPSVILRSQPSSLLCRSIAIGFQQ